MSGNSKKKIVILVLLILILGLLYLNSNIYKVSEHFSGYARCERRPLGGIYKEIFKEENVDLNNDLESCGLYYPCGYNGVEKELRNLDLGQNNKNRDIFGICGSDVIASKSSLWKVVSEYYGREKGSKLIPESFLLKDNRELPIFKEKFDPGKVYILKKNIQRKKGIKLTSDYNEISEANKKKYVMVQEKKESIIINKRRMNLRIYIFVQCKNGVKSVFIHEKAKCLYTSKDVIDPVNSNGEEFETLITNSYVTDLEIYNKNPLTLNKLLEYLENNNGVNGRQLKQKIYTNITEVFQSLLPKVCNCANLQGNNMYQMFGADILIDKQYNVYMLEVNKGPDMKHKDEADHELKKRVVFDTFEKMGVVKPKTSEYKNGYTQVI